MKKMKFFLAVLMALISNLAIAQNLTVTGTVKDSSTGEPVPFAAIQLKGTMTGGMTDGDGIYAIDVPADGVLIFSSVGYKDLEVEVAGKAIHDVMMDPDTETIEETIVVAFGTATKESFTGSATVVKSSDIQKTQSSDVTRALEGMVAGVQMTTPSGSLGSSPSIMIRGISSITAGTAPLYVVDGVPYSGDMNNLNSADIESMTVLKDAAAVALYGHEAVNGVLLVKTKRGVAGSGNHLKVGASHKLQFDPDFADMVSAYDYANALNIARANDGLAAAYTESELQKFLDGSDPYVYPNVNWKDEVFKNTAHETNAFISMFGGTDRVQYYSLIDYTDARGLYANPNQGDWNSQLKYSKANIRTNVDFQVTESTRVKTNILALFMETNGVPNINSSDAWWHLYKVPALAFPIKTQQGTWGGSQTYGDFNLLAKSQGAGFSKTHQRQIWADITLEQDLDIILKGLQFYAGGSYDNSSNTIENRTKGYQYGWNYYDAEGKLAETVMGTVQDKLTFNHWVDSQWRVGTLKAGFKYEFCFHIIYLSRRKNSILLKIIY